MNWWHHRDRHRHDWLPVGVEHGKYVLLGGDATLVRYRCASCPAAQTVTMDGTWTLRELVDPPDPSVTLEGCDSP